jgi:hypothetical protein
VLGGHIDESSDMDDYSPPDNTIFGIQPNPGSNSSQTYAFIAAGITLLVILSYSVVKYGTLNKKED